MLEGRSCELFQVFHCGLERLKVHVGKVEFSQHNDDCIRFVVSFLEASFCVVLAPRSLNMNLQSPQALQLYGIRIFSEYRLQSVWVKRIWSPNLRLRKAATPDSSPETDVHSYVRKPLVSDPGIETKDNKRKSSEPPNCQTLIQTQPPITKKMRKAPPPLTLTLKLLTNVTRNAPPAPNLR